MSANLENEIITEASPHSIKKFELIERYVSEWAIKILELENKKTTLEKQGIVYIDCMSNSGKYKDKNGNLIDGTALLVAKQLNEIIKKYPKEEAILYFNDKNEARIDFLRQEIEKAELNNIIVYYSHEDCNDFLESLKINDWKNNHNTLLIYDPYNAAINWKALKPFLNIWGEVIINHMVSDTPRGASQAKKAEVINRYEETYEQDIDTIIKLGSDKEKLNKIIIEIINKRRDKNKSKLYIASFPFFSSKNGLLYNLIFCSSNIAGIKLFKKEAWKTFGDKSSTKDTHGSNEQKLLDFEGDGMNETETDTECFYISDIAKYIYHTFASRENMEWNEITKNLDEHPIFPSEGYLNDIKKELRELYHVKFRRGHPNEIIEFKTKD